MKKTKKEKNNGSRESFKSIRQKLIDKAIKSGIVDPEDWADYIIETNRE